MFFFSQLYIVGTVQGKIFFSFHHARARVALRPGILAVKEWTPQTISVFPRFSFGMIESHTQRSRSFHW